MDKFIKFQKAAKTVCYQVKSGYQHSLHLPEHLKKIFPYLDSEFMTVTYILSPDVLLGTKYVYLPQYKNVIVQLILKYQNPLGLGHSYYHH